MRAVRLKTTTVKDLCQNNDLKDDTTLRRTGGNFSQSLKFFLNFY